MYLYGMKEKSDSKEMDCFKFGGTQNVTAILYY